MAVCSRCGRAFQRVHRERYCSTECRGAAKSRKLTLRCYACGAAFKVPPSRQNAKYCSAACKHIHFGLAMRKRDVKACLTCGRDFETHPSVDNDYCSYACAFSARENKETRVCAECGEAFSVRASSPDICCSWECRVERLRGENHPSWRGGKLPNYAGDWVRAKRLARERDGDTCQECGKTAREAGENMSVHHIRPYRSFDDPHEANVLNNLISLCRSCHARQPE